MGYWSARASRALYEVAGAEHVYAAIIGDAVPHLHLHLLPRFPGTPREYWSTRMDEWPQARRGGAAESGRSSGSCAGTWATEHPGSALVRSSVRERRLRAARQFNRSAGSGIDLLSCLGCAHRWGWTIRLNPDGTTTATSPDGMENAAQSQPATGGVTAGRDLLVHVRLLANCRSGSWTSERFWGVVRAASRP